jgi:adenosylcobinamide-GDP ribazoletransferase
VVPRAGRSLLLAIEFLSIVRLRRNAVVDDRTVGESINWFPLVGLLIGALLVLVDRAARWALPVPVATALVITAWMLITGALHLDGVADTADGIFGGHTPGQRLEIMKDSRIGTFGVVAVALWLLLAFASLSSLTGGARITALLAAPTAARTGVVACIPRFPAVRSSGLGRLYKDAFTFNPAFFLVGVVALPLVAPSTTLAVLLMGLVLLSIALAWFAVRRLGGLTGDVYGAIIAVTEAAALALAAGLAKHGLDRAW